MECSNGSPITPVEARYISFISIFISYDNFFKISFTDILPFFPLNTFAFPELINNAEILALLMIDLFQIIGSPGVLDFVKTAKIKLGLENLIRTKSSFLFFFKPQ